MWDVLARRPWVGVASSDLKGTAIAPLPCLCHSPSVVSPAVQVAELERASEELFEEGLSVVRSACAERGVEPAADDVAALWGHYFTWAVERLEDASSHKSRKKVVCEARHVAWLEGTGVGVVSGCAESRLHVSRGLQLWGNDSADISRICEWRALNKF